MHIPSNTFEVVPIIYSNIGFKFTGLRLGKTLTISKEVETLNLNNTNNYLNIDDWFKTKPNMAILTNVYKRMLSFDDLMISYQEARKLKRYRHEVLKYSDNLEENLITLLNDLKNETYKVGIYRRFEVVQPKLRLISALPFNDRIVQWSIYRIINPFYERLFIEDSYACRKTKGTIAALTKFSNWLKYLHLVDKRIQKSSSSNSTQDRIYYLKLDISKFFYRIDHKVLMRIINRRIKDKRLLNLLDIIINNPYAKFGLPRGKNPEDIKPNQWLTDVGMPIGNLTSQLFANVYMNELDQFCKHNLKIKYYIRYMDDIMILGKKKFLDEIRPKIKWFINNVLKLDINHKTRLAPITEKIEFVGYFISPFHIGIRKNTSKRMKIYMRHLIRKYDLNLIPFRDIQKTIDSYCGLFKYSNSNQLRQTIYNIINSSKRLQSLNRKIEFYMDAKDIYKMMKDVIDDVKFINLSGRLSLTNPIDELSLSIVDNDNYNDDDEEIINNDLEYLLDYQYDNDNIDDEIEYEKWFDYYQDYIQDY